MNNEKVFVRSQMTLKEGIKALKDDPTKILRHKDFSDQTFIFLRPEDTVPEEFVSKIKTIPDSIKSHIPGELTFPSTWALLISGSKIEPIRPKKMFKRYSPEWEVICHNEVSAGFPQPNGRITTPPYE